MALDFSGQNLRGRSFIGRDLAGANFSNAHIQGANFSESVLSGACFRQAKAGTSYRSRVLLWLLLIVSGAMVGGIGTVIADTVNTDYLTIFGPRDAILAFSVLTILGVVLCLRDLLSAIIVTLLCGLLTWISFIVWEFTYSGDFLHVLVGAEAITVDVITMIVIFWAGLSGVIGLCSVLMASAHFQAHCRRQIGPFEMVTWVSAMVIALTAGLYLPGTVAKVNAFVDTAIVWWLSIYASRQIVREHPRYRWFRSIALSVGAWGGTNFRQAKLSGADFSLARLNATAFTAATLTRTCFREAQFLDYALVNGTLLEQSAVRRLVVTGQGARQNYTGLDLRGAYLVDTDLLGADLTDADISRGDLTGARLVESQLVRTQAVATCFRGAQLTGSCLESWNIDTTTQLEGVVCDY
ncbi:MAG: pentapeptide repeat-containing protein, partial [Cyanobacteria bacterium J06632_3]